MSILVKRLMWLSLGVVTMAAASLLARRMTVRIWRAATGEEPPPAIVSPS